MDNITYAGLFGAGALAFANGANDISKSIATLIASEGSGYKKAVIVVSLATAAGAVLASALAVKMTLLFTKGMLSPAVQINQLFALAVLAGAIAWILLSTKLGLPVSTTHAIVGSIVLTGIYAFGFNDVLWANVGKKVLLPLLLSPIVACGASFFIFRFLFWLCRQQYCFNCRWMHWLSAIAGGFARGLNDTPKIAALGLAFYHLINPDVALAPKWFFLMLAGANALGGMVMGFKVTDTLAHKITKLNHLEGFAANVATSSMVIATAIQGFPVSTTHVAGSAITGMGLHNGFKSVQWKIVRDIVAAWLLTLPTAGLLSVAAYWFLRRIV